MALVTSSPGPVRWCVMWKKGDRVFEHDCDSDFHEALRVYVKVLNAGRVGATLRCYNYAFPPPASITQAERYEVVDRKGRPWKGKGKKYKKTIIYNRMEELNRQGWWWCPYCIKMRRFEKGGEYWEEVEIGGKLHDVWVAKKLRCVMCGIALENGAVRLYNPFANNIILRDAKRTRRGSGKRKRRRK